MARTPAATSGMPFAAAPPVLMAASDEVVSAAEVVLVPVASAVELMSDEVVDAEDMDDVEVVMVEEPVDEPDEEALEVESALTVPVALPARDSVGAPSDTAPVEVATVLSESMTK